MMQGERERLFNDRGGRMSGDRQPFSGADNAYFVEQIGASLQQLKAAQDPVARGMAMQGLSALLVQEAARRVKEGPDFSADLTKVAQAALKRLKAAGKSKAKAAAKRDRKI